MPPLRQTVAILAVVCSLHLLSYHAFRTSYQFQPPLADFVLQQEEEQSIDVDHYDAINVDHYDAMQQQNLPFQTRTNFSDPKSKPTIPFEYVEEKETNTTKKSRFVLHIGPQKTGSTSLQCILLQAADILQSQNYVYTGKAPSPSMCRNQNATTNVTTLSHTTLYRCAETPLCWSNFRRRLSKHRDTHLVYSHENIPFITSHDLRPHRFSITPHDFWTKLLEALEPHWELTIVVVYRRYYDWLASSKNQHDQPGHHRFALYTWPNATKEDQGILSPVFETLQAWDHNRSLTPYPYVDEILDYLEQEHQIPRLMQDEDHHTAASPHVVLLNMHHGQDPTATFLTQVLGIPHDEALRQVQQHPVAHSSIWPFYDMLAVEAYQRNWVRRSKRVGRKWVTSKTKAHQTKDLLQSPLDFPLVCPTHDEASFLLDRTRYYESKLWPNQQPSVSLEEEFKDFVDRQKLCTVDVDAVLEDPGWEEFFKSL